MHSECRNVTVPNFNFLLFPGRGKEGGRDTGVLGGEFGQQETTVQTSMFREFITWQQTVTFNGDI